MFRTFVFIVCAVHAEFWDSGDTRSSTNGWLENLKRRLMVDNYDYQQSSGDLELRALHKVHSNAPVETTTETTTDAPTYDLLQALGKANEQVQFVYDSAERIKEKAEVFNEITTMRSFYMPRHRVDDVHTLSVPRNSIEERDDYQGISRNDLQIYLKDSKSQRPEMIGAQKNVSYKVIQPSLLSRRAGAAAPRFVEEVGATGVSLLSVDGAPFPEFQLPSARRQYQADKDSEDWMD